VKRGSFFYSIGDFILRSRVMISAVAFSLLLIWDIFFEKVRPRALFSLEDVWGPFGTVFVLGGLFFRSWAAGVISKGETLATTGPYALTRHPLYAGTFLIITGFCILIPDGKNIWVVSALAIFIYLPKMRREEFLNSIKFGEQWKRYVERTSVLFPKTFAINIRSGWSISRWLENREYRGVLFSLLMLVFVVFWREFFYGS